MASGVSSPSRASRGGARLARCLGVVGSLLLLATSCGHLVYADGPYRGRVLDKEFKRPIQGAAVLAVWWKDAPALGHPTTTYYDAQETVTDSDGRFTIRGIVGGSANPMAKIRPPLFTIFAPTYEAFGDRRLPTPDVIEGVVVELRPLTTRADRIRNLDRIHIARFCQPGETSASCIPREQSPNLLRLREVELQVLQLR